MWEAEKSAIVFLWLVEMFTQNLVRSSIAPYATMVLVDTDADMMTWELVAAYEQRQFDIHSMKLTPIFRLHPWFRNSSKSGNLCSRMRDAKI